MRTKEVNDGIIPAKKDTKEKVESGYAKPDRKTQSTNTPPKSRSTALCIIHPTKIEASERSRQ
jgi:hypothetical protein